MRVRLGSIDVDDDVRRAIRSLYGKSGLATREEVRNFWNNAADTDLSDVVHEWRRQQQDTSEQSTNHSQDHKE